MLTGIVELAEEVFNLPARIGVPQEMGGVSERIRNPRYSTAIGLLQTAYAAEEGEQTSRTGAIALNDSGKKNGSVGKNPKDSSETISDKKRSGQAM